MVNKGKVFCRFATTEKGFCAWQKYHEANGETFVLFVFAYFDNFSLQHWKSFCF